MDSLKRDIAYSLRALVAARKFTTIVIATLALGLGANTAVFSVLDAVVLRPLPYPEPARLVRIYQTVNAEDIYMPGPALLAYRHGSSALDIAPVYTYSSDGADLTDGARPERVTVLPVGADYFRVVGVQPVVGQPFSREDERRGSGVVVISERIWRDYLGASLDAVGRSLALNGVRHRVVAVLPAGFVDPLVSGVEIWVPIDLQTASTNQWYNHYLSAIGRLRPGATLAQAQSELTTIAAQIASKYPGSKEHRSARVAPLQADTVGTSANLLWMLLGAVGLLLVIACVNVAGLMVARGSAREPELAVRAALGASRWQLARQLVIESLLLALAGGAIGLVCARLVTRVLVATAPDTVARTAAGAGWSAPVFAFGLVAALVAGLAFAVMPALRLARPDIEQVLRASGRGASGGRGQARFRQALVISQIGLALVLVTGAGLLLRSFERLARAPLGLQPADVLTFEINLPTGRYGEPERRAAFHLALQERLAAIPGVRAAGAVSRLPVTGMYHDWNVGRTDRGGDVQANQRVVEGRFFDALSIPVVRGRGFGPQDGAAPRQVVINERLARTLFPGEDPVGRPLRAGGGIATIIGVAGDVPVDPRVPAPAMVYHLHRQFAANRNWGLVQVVSTARPEASVLADVRRVLQGLDAGLVVHRPRRLDEVIGRAVAQERFAMVVVGAYAALALMLAAVGVYGVLSYSVSRRRREMGIRLALGAPIASVRALVVREGGVLAITGVAIGLAAALAATRSLSALLHGVSATDASTFAMSAGVLLLVAGAASWIPARAATRVDPIEALRGEG
jgi:putative ABC transport system permease protein